MQLPHRFLFAGGQDPIHRGGFKSGLFDEWLCVVLCLEAFVSEVADLTSNETSQRLFVQVCSALENRGLTLDNTRILSDLAFGCTGAHSEVDSVNLMCLLVDDAMHRVFVFDRSEVLVFLLKKLLQ